jgi:hypothetical protein
MIEKELWRQEEKHIDALGLFNRVCLGDSGSPLSSSVDVRALLRVHEVGCGVHAKEGSVSPMVWE